MIRRTAAATLLAAALLLQPAAPLSASASSRAWEVCFTAGFESCSTFHLLTQPILWEGTDVRIGTFVDVLVRHGRGLAEVSALYAVSFGYWSPLDAQQAGGDGVTPGLTLTPEAVGGAAAAAPDGWAVDASSFTGVPEFTYFHLYNNTFAPNLGGRLYTQMIAGCGVGAQGELDDFFGSTLSTCGEEEAYRFRFETEAIFEAALFRHIQVDHYGRFFAEPELTAWTCTAYLDGSPSEGVDYGSGEAGDFCRATALQGGGGPGDPGGDPNVVPEPASMALLATGLAGLGAARRRRRRQAQDTE